MGKVWLKKAKGVCVCEGCGFINSDGKCKLNIHFIYLDCGDKIFQQITEQQFNDTPGKKHSIKNGVRREL
jgi:hypothetical protein